MAPSTPEEALLCSLVGELLGLERVGVGDDFFALGGHSLLAARLAARVRERSGRELPLRLVFERPVLGSLAAALRGLPRADGPALAAGVRPERVPLSFAQRRLWFLHRLEGPEAATYHMALALRLRGGLDAVALRRAFLDLLARHESLRTLLVEEGGEPWQLVLPAGEAAARFAFASAACDEAGLGEALAGSARRGFELAHDLPLRVALFRLGPDEHALLVVQHHVAGDGWSWRPLLADLAAAYAARAVGGMPELAPLPLHYADYALWQRELLGAADDPSSRLGRQLAWWRERLAGLPEALALPADRPRPLVASGRGGRVALAIDAGLHGRLLELARAQGATLFMVLQAGVAVLLHRLGAGEDIPLGAPVAGRGEAALDGLVGFFVNTLVLRCDLAGRPGFARLLARVRDGDVAAFAHGETPFELVVDALAPARALERNPLFQVMVVLQNHASARLALPGLACEALPLDLGVAKFDLAFEFAERPDGSGGLDGRLDYAADLFDPATARALAERLVRLLAAAAADPELPVGRLELLAPEERRRLVEEPDAAAAPLPGGTVVELLRAQAARTPDATALVQGDERLGYAELHAGANRLARLLVGRGVGPEVVVGLCLERSFRLVEAVLAVLAAGGAYLPLDPDHPPERLASTLADVAPALVLTTRDLAPRLPAGVAALALDDPAVLAEPRPLPANAPDDGERRAPPAPAAPGLPHLHLRLHRNPQGRHRHSPGAAELRVRHNPAPADRRQRAGWRSSPRSASTAPLPSWCSP